MNLAPVPEATIKKYCDPQTRKCDIRGGSLQTWKLVVNPVAQATSVQKGSDGSFEFVVSLGSSLHSATDAGGWLKIHGHERLPASCGESVTKS